MGVLLSILLAASQGPLREVGCWPWDVCAGIIIAQEAGGLVTGPHAVYNATKNSDSFGDVTEDILMGRKYIVVRAVGDTEVCDFWCRTSILNLRRRKKDRMRRKELSESFLTPSSTTMSNFRASSSLHNLQLEHYSLCST